MSLLGVALLSTLILFSLSVFYFVNLTESEAWRGRQGEAVRSAAGRISGFVQRVREAIILVSIVEPDHLVEDPDELENLLRVNPSLQELVRIDRDGKVLVSAHTDEQMLASLITIPQSQWFLEARNGQAYLGNVQLSINNEPYLIMAVPTPQGGVVAARVRVNILWDVVRDIRFGDSGRAYVITRAGNIVAHTDPAVVIAGTNIQGRPEFEALMGAPNNEWFGTYTNFEGRKVVGTTSPIPGTDWLVITELPQQEAFAVSWVAVFILGTEALLLMTIVSWSVGRFVRILIVHPMEQLRQGAGEIGQGNLDHRIELNRKDEIGQLARAFNDMALNLSEHEQMITRHAEVLAAEVEERKRTEGELQDAKDKLEFRVKERTHELQRVNEKLEIELKERIRAVEALRDSETRYQTLVERIPAAVYIWEPGKNGACRYISPQIEKMLGFSVAEWLADPDLFFRQVHPDDRSLAIANEKRSEATGGPLHSEFRMITRDERILWIRDEAVVLPLVEGYPRLNQGFLYNITEMKEAEAALKESQERYELAVRGANDGIWDWDLRTNRIFFSPRWKSMLGFGEDEITDNPDEWFNRVHSEEQKQVQTDLVLHLKGHMPLFQSEYRIRHANGTDLWVLSRGLAVRDADGIAYRMAGSQTDITARKNAEERLAYDALHDPLTGLPNRVLFMDRLKNRLERTRRNPKELFAIMFMDLDRFKVVNDSLGHAIGDQLLITTAQRLQKSLRPEDTVARLSGDEFAILLDEIKEVGDALRVADRIKGHLVTTSLLGAVERSPTASIGIAMYKENYGKPEELLRDADSAMYRAKALGGNCHQLFDETMYASAVALLQLEGELKRAVERQEWQVDYQPIVSLADGETVGVEALIRWLHPQRGIVSPLEFIQVAEDIGFIIPIGEFVLRAACRQAKVWRDAGHSKIWVSVNLSGRQFQDKDLVAKIADILAETGVPSDALRLEVTESVAMRDLEYSIRILKELDQLGVYVSLDDFGNGYSSLSYLKKFPLKVLKIDQSFIQDIKVNKNSEAITRAILAMARSLNLEVIAEGVEKEEQLAFLRSLFCDNVQGFLLSRPARADDLNLSLRNKLIQFSHTQNKSSG